jgi:hypothetical protein
MTYIVALDIQNLSHGLIQLLQLIHQQHANLYASLAECYGGEQAVSYLNRVARAMPQPPLFSLLDVGLYTLGVQLLRFAELLEALSMTLFLGSKVTGQSQQMVDFWNESTRNLRLLLVMTAGRW